MTRRVLLTSAHVGALLAILGIVAWAFGMPFVFPSLGPSAFLLANLGRTETTAPRRLVGGHAVGVVAGLAAYHVFAPGLIVVDPGAVVGESMLRLAGSAVSSVTLTTAGMLLTDTTHPPACATTLIVSLGLLSTPVEGAVILVAVAVLSGTNAVLVRIGRRTLALTSPD